MKTYKEAGVDKEEGYRAVNRIKASAAATHNENVLSGLGSFASLYALKGYENPVLVSGTDGVGTKLALAFQKKIYHSVGRDCFAMCANDILCQGAEPLFFLDYLACGKLDAEVSAQLVRGMADACAEASCCLVGGETAEMPGFYKDGDYDMAGFCVGVVERERLVDGSAVREGDVILGLASEGVHSNGFSLIRSAVDNMDEAFRGEPLYRELLRPTRVYVPSVLALLRSHPGGVRGMAHITGGGLPENLPRALPEGLRAVVEKAAVPVSPIFAHLQGKGIPEEEMWGTFNMGIGFALIVSPEEEAAFSRILAEGGERVHRIGRVEAGDRGLCLT